MSTAALLLAALFAVMSPAEDGRVTVDRGSFNPAAGETITIAVRTQPPSRVSVTVLDRDGFVVRALAENAAADEDYSVVWDGRGADGALVADEAYSFKVDVQSPAGNWTYFPALQPARSFTIQAKQYSRHNAALLYDLPAAARVHAQAGSAQLDPATKLYNGPVLKTLVNREPRPAGAIVESWNGRDESGRIYVPDLPGFVTAVLATSLPDNAVIAYGNHQRTFLEAAAARGGASLLPAQETDAHTHHRGLPVLEDISPSLVFTPANATWNEAAGAWTIAGDTARVDVSLAGPTAASVAKQPGRVIVFVDYVYAFEQPVRGPVATLDIPLRGAKTREPRIVSINWQSSYGPLAANSLRLASAGRRKAAEARHEGR